MGRAVAAWPAGERRGAQRIPTDGLGELRLVEVVPGYVAVVYDWSPAGVLISTGMRLVPGGRVRLCFKGASPAVAVGARVVRSAVVARQPGGGLTYRAGLAFDRPMSIGYLTKASSVVDTRPRANKARREPRDG